MSKDKLKSDRNYLLSINPSSMCKEFSENSPSAYQLLVQGLIGVSDMESISENKHLKNNISLIYSTLSKLVNRKATGFALVQTAAARDGGLREDSIKLFSNFCHPRTMQRYDSEVLAKNWDKELKKTLANEFSHFEALREAEEHLAETVQQGLVDGEAEAEEKVQQLLDTVPPQVQCVWDNLNLRSKHRFPREGDNYGESNLDWMASLWIKERIVVNNMEHSQNSSIKKVSDLTIADFVPSQKELDYLFRGLIRYYSYRLVHRHPILFKSINSSVRVNQPHQFEAEMSKKSEEFTGDLFTKSESNTQDLLEMMVQVQDKYVHKYIDASNNINCFEKKVLSGDQKTEKNSYFGILRYYLQENLGGSFNLYADFY